METRLSKAPLKFSTIEGGRWSVGNAEPRPLHWLFEPLRLKSLADSGLSLGVESKLKCEESFPGLGFKGDNFVLTPRVGDMRLFVRYRFRDEESQLRIWPVDFSAWQEQAGEDEAIISLGDLKLRLDVKGHFFELETEEPAADVFVCDTLIVPSDFLSAGNRNIILITDELERKTAQKLRFPKHRALERTSA